MKRKFAAVEKYVAVLQAHIRRRMQVRKYRAYLKVKVRARVVHGAKGCAGVHVLMHSMAVCMCMYMCVCVCVRVCVSLMPCLMPRGCSLLQNQAGLIIQRNVVMYHHRRRFVKCRRGFNLLAACARRKAAVARYHRMVRGFTRLQAVARASRVRYRLAKESSAIKIQAVFRGHKARKRVARLRRVKVTGCVVIQAEVRRYLCQKRYTRLKVATGHAQRLYRGKLARRAVARLRAAVATIKNRLLSVGALRVLCIACVVCVCVCCVCVYVCGYVYGSWCSSYDVASYSAWCLLCITSFPLSFALCLFSLCQYTWRRRYLHARRGFTRLQAVVRGVQCRHQINLRRSVSRAVLVCCCCVVLLSCPSSRVCLLCRRRTCSHPARFRM